MSREFIMPQEILTGENALNEASNTLKTLGKKALIVTDKIMVELGNVKRLEDVLNKEGISYVIYPEINGEPTDNMIDGGISLYKNESCDFLIALGGGSPIDSMKAIAAIVANGGKISDYMGKIIGGSLPNTVAIPTTAGTGSEATQFTIITDTKNNIKMLLKGKVLMPKLAIIDPVFTMTAPPKITAATGLDALTHAIEAYTSRKAQGLSDTFALSAVKRIFKYLKKAYDDGSNIEARCEMSVAALEAGIAFNNSSVTIVHGMSRPIGALFHVPHGLSNAMLMKECFDYVVDGAYDRFATLGRVIEVASKNDSDEKASRNFLDAVNKLIADLDTPSIVEFGINKDEFIKVIDKMSIDAMDSGSPGNTRKELKAEDLVKIYKALV